MQDDRDPLAEAVYRCAEYGGGPEVTITIPESATITVTDDRSTHMLDGAVTSWWVD